MTRFAAICALFSACWIGGAQTVKANEACDALASQLDDLAGVQSYLEDISTEKATCGIALQSGGAKSAHCYVAFEYRADSAAAHFAKIESQLSTCFERISTDGAGQIVNHPDSFDQFRFCTASTTLSLSLKDKANLGQTLIFLRAAQSGDQTTACPP